MTDRQKFLHHVDITWSCWNWTGAVNEKGYGRYTVNGKNWAAHRYSFLLYKDEPLDPSLQVDHTCRNRRCVRPEHLEQVTASENMLRAVPFRKVSKKLIPCMNGHDNMVLTKSGELMCGTCIEMADEALATI